VRDGRGARQAQRRTRGLPGAHSLDRWAGCADADPRIGEGVQFRQRLRREYGVQTTHRGAATVKRRSDARHDVNAGVEGVTRIRARGGVSPSQS
jgi:hypothetical protein